MLTVVLNGSPNASGHTGSMARRILENIGGEHVIVDAYAENVAACVQCGHCASRPECRVRDGMEAIRRHVEAADVIVIASPLHFGSPTGPLVSLFSRLQPYWEAAKRRDGSLPVKKKRAALVLSGGSDYPGMFLPALGVADIVLRRLNAELAGCVLAAGTDRTPASENRAALSQASWLGKTLAEPPPGAA